MSRVNIIIPTLVAYRWLSTERARKAGRKSAEQRKGDNPVELDAIQEGPIRDSLIFHPTQRVGTSLRVNMEPRRPLTNSKPEDKLVVTPWFYAPEGMQHHG